MPGPCKRMTVVMGLDTLMREAGATNIALAFVVGCSDNTVKRARLGVSIKQEIADAILQALRTKKFTRAPQGRK